MSLLGSCSFGLSGLRLPSSTTPLDSSDRFSFSAVKLDGGLSPLYPPDVTIVQLLLRSDTLLLLLFMGSYNLRSAFYIATLQARFRAPTRTSAPRRRPTPASPAPARSRALAHARPSHVMPQDQYRVYPTYLPWQQE